MNLILLFIGVQRENCEERFELTRLTETAAIVRQLEAVRLSVETQTSDNRENRTASADLSSPGRPAEHE